MSDSYDTIVIPKEEREAAVQEIQFNIENLIDSLTMAEYGYEEAIVGNDKNKTIADIIIDDAMSAHEELMMRIKDDDDYPLEIYQYLLSQKTGEDISLEETKETLITNVQKRSKEHATTVTPEQMAPKFLLSLMHSSERDIVDAASFLCRQWLTNIVTNIAKLPLSDDAVRASAECLQGYASGTTEAMRLAMENAKAAAPKTRPVDTASPENEQRFPAEMMQDTVRKTPKQQGVNTMEDQYIPEGIDQSLATELGEMEMLNFMDSRELPKIFGRVEEVKQIGRIMRHKNTPFALLKGPAGVGRTRLVEDYAKDNIVLTVGLDDITMTHANPQTQPHHKLNDVISLVAQHNKSSDQKITLHIKDFGKGNAAMSGSQHRREYLSLLRSAVANAMSSYGPDLPVIAETTDEDFFRIEKEAKDAVKLFQRIEVESTDFDETLDILRRHAAECAEHNHITIGEDMLKRIIKQADRHLPLECQPKKSLAILEDASASAEIDNREAMTAHDVDVAVATRANKPIERVGTNFSDLIDRLPEELPKRVIGQPGLTDITGHLSASNGGFDDDNKPLGAFLAVGPTGTGKTETAEALGELLGKKVIRIDMGNFSQEHNKAKLIGSPPGYIGYNDKAALEQVAENPDCVLVLDEIEKSHSDIFNILLPMFDKAEVQLMNGKTVDFRECIVLMTSNLGEREAADARNKKQVGVKAQTNATTNAEEKTKDAAKARMEKIRKILPPEFIGRVEANGGIIEYQQLTDEVVEKIAVMKIKKLSNKLHEKNENLTMELSPSGMAELKEIGFDNEYGARPMEGAVSKNIRTPLAEWFKKNGTSITTPTTLYVKSIKDKFEVALKKPSNDNQKAPAKKKARRSGTRRSNGPK